MLRHGQTFSNINRRMDTRPPGAELTQRGRDQAASVGRELAEFCAGRTVRFACSVALRAQQTAMTAMQEYVAAIGGAELPVDVLWGLHEVFAGDHEMSGSEDTYREYMGALRGWLAGDEHARMPGGENYLDVLDRFRPQLERIAQDLREDEDVVVVSHGAAIRVATAHACGVDPDFAFSGYLPNCRFTVMEPGGADFGQWRLTRWVDTDI